MNCIYRAYLGGLWGAVVHHHNHMSRLRGRYPHRMTSYMVRQQAKLDDAREWAMSETARLGGYVPAWAVGL